MAIANCHRERERGHVSNTEVYKKGSSPGVPETALEKCGRHARCEREREWARWRRLTLLQQNGVSSHARTEGVIAAQHASNFNRRGYCCAARVLLK
jgi:hypothetical protein